MFKFDWEKNLRSTELSKKTTPFGRSSVDYGSCVENRGKKKTTIFKKMFIWKLENVYVYWTKKLILLLKLQQQDSSRVVLHKIDFRQSPVRFVYFLEIIIFSDVVVHNVLSSLICLLFCLSYNNQAVDINWFTVMFAIKRELWFSRIWLIAQQCFDLAPDLCFSCKV